MTFRRRISRSRWTYLAVPIGFIAFGWMLQFTLMLVDPFSIYPWTPARVLEPSKYAVGLAPHLLNVVERNNTEVVVTGSSTCIAFHPRDVSTILASNKPAANLCYDAPRPLDFKAVLDHVAASKAQRVVLMLDLFYLFPASVAQNNFPFWLYSKDVSDKFNVTDRATLEAAWRVFRNDGVTIPGWNFAQWRRRVDVYYRNWTSDSVIASKRLTVDRARSMVASTADLSCEDLSAVQQILLPFAREMSRSGRRLDIVTPVYGQSLFSDFALNPEGPMNKVFDRTLRLRECVLAGIEGLIDVTLHALDQDDSIVDDEGNFYNAGHVYPLDLYRDMLRHIAAGDRIVTSKTFPAYADRLRERMSRYSFTSVRRWPPSTE